MEDGDLDADHGEESGPVCVTGLAGEGLDGGIGGKAGVDPNQNRSSCSPKRDRGALNDHAGHHRRHGREAESHQKGHGDGRRCSEAGRAFDEGAEEPGDDDDLDPTIGSDAGESLTDRLKCTTLLEGVQQEDGAEDDVEERSRHDEAVDRSRRDLDKRHLPNEKRQHDGYHIGQGHGSAGRPS